MEGRKKAFQWFTMASTCVSAEESESTTDYINSGGNFSDIAVPVIYIKCLMDHETLKVFMPALTKAIGKGISHCTRTIVDTLSDVVLTHMPKRARLTRLLQRIKTNKIRGDHGENLITYSEGLFRDLH